MIERRIEEAALNSWPALQQLLFDGWILRFAQGYTKRANSVTPLYPPLQAATVKIAYCENFYQERHLPTIFRLPSFVTESAALDQLLAQRGYQMLDQTQVLSAELTTDMTTNAASIQQLSRTEWFSIYRRFSILYREKQALHLDLLERISPPVLYAALYQQGVPVACGLGVMEHDALGIFDIVTDPTQRRKGYGTRLISGMLAWGRQQQARYAYLQVIENNHAALQLYKKIGFQPCYTYWYRQHSLKI